MKDFFKKFIRRNIPSKGDSKKQIVLKTAFLILLIVLIICIWQIAGYVVDYLGELQSESQIESLYTPSDSGTVSSISSSSSSANISGSFSKLVKTNSDVVGWIKIANTKIDNVVAQSDDNSYYLTRSFYKIYSGHGTLFLDYRDLINPLSKNLIIYGHHMKDGTMFHDLIKYKKLSFYNESPTIEFNTLYGNMQWRIFAVFIANTEEKDGPVFDYLRTDFNSNTDYENFITQIKRRSLFNISVDVDSSDTILTLSTCTYEINDARLVVVARLLRNGETAGAAEAVKNPDPLMPDAWYKKYGGTKPTFSDSSES